MSAQEFDETEASAADQVEELVPGEEATPIQPADEAPVEDMELAYRMAMQAIDEAEREVGSALRELAEETADGPDAEEVSDLSIGASLKEADQEEAGGAAGQSETDGTSDRIRPTAVIEAALFVGGEGPISARKLASLISHDPDPRYSIRQVELLNERYRAQQRPYHIQLHEGGYQLELRDAFQDLAYDLYGFGPREVTLAPETLEVLSFIAYNQPLSKEDLLQTDRSGIMTPVRQLLRLNLVERQQTGPKKKDQSFVTTQRFLDLFELESLEDLPHAEIFQFR